MTEDEFFAATDQLKMIHQWARARYAARKAVLGSVMLRVSTSTEPGLRLPGVIGGPASLNLGVVFVSRSGGGKGISDKVGALAWPADIHERPIGSGEGIAALFMPPKKDGVKPVTRALLSVPEIDTLAGVAARQGSILLAQLKSALMGELIGQSNASDATTRIVQAHTYRCGLSIGAQPGHTGVIFNDTTGGTPQRLLWLPTTDPDMPADPMADPLPLDTKLPPWADNGGVIVYGPSEIEQTIVSAHLARQRGEGDALDGHALLTRCKVAAVLAVMHHRTVVDDLFWELSGTVMEWSNTTRDWILGEAKRAERAKVRDRAISRAYGEEAVDDRRAEVVRRRIFKILGEGPATHGTVHSRIGKREYKDLFPDVIASLLLTGEVASEDTQRGKRYSLGDGVNVDPWVKVDNSRSDALTLGVKVDPSATVTDLESRRSHENDRPAQTTRAWLIDHLTALRNAGHQQAESFAVIAAGETEGHKPGTIRAEASQRKDMIIMSRRGDNTVWWIDLHEPPPYVWQPAKEWIDSYVAEHPGGLVDRAELRTACEARGYEWPHIRNLMNGHDDVESKAAGQASTWTVIRLADEAS